MSDKDDYSRLPAYKAWKPLMFGMRLVGLHYIRREQRWSSPCVLYSWFVVACTWVFVVINVSALMNVMSVGPVLFCTLTAILSFSHHAINATCLAKASHNPKALRQFFTCLSQLHKYGGLLTPQAWLIKVIKIASALGLACYAVAFFYALRNVCNVHARCNVYDKRHAQLQNGAPF